MKYNFVYCLLDPGSCVRKYFSTESLAFQYADKFGLKNYEVYVFRYYFDLDDLDD